MGKIPTSFAVSGTFRSRLMGQHLLDGPRDLLTMTFDFGGHGTARDAALHAPTALVIIRVFLLNLYTKLEVRRSSYSEDMTHFRSQH